MNYTSTYFNGLVHLLYPHVCAGCGDDVIGHEELLCLDCISKLPFTGFHVHKGNPVEKIFYGRIDVSSATSLVYFTKGSIMQTLLHQLKYKGRRDIGNFLGRLLGDALLTQCRFTNVDVIVPLPLFKAKEKKRGYNQSEIISQGMAEALGKPVATDVVRKVEKTETQTKMNRADRWENSRNKFEVLNGESITNKHVLLVDDVITTGATIEACGSTMLKVAGVRLSIASIAYTLT